MPSNDTTFFPQAQPDADPTLTIGERPEPVGEPSLEDLVVTESAVTPRGLLGHGGMGLVQRAVQNRMRREIAVKVLLDDSSAERVQALVREAWVAGALEHPNILPIHDVFLTEDHRPTLLMKRVEGRPWRELLADEQAVREQGAEDVTAWHLDVLCSVCHAVEFAHSRGVLHRDIKPDNVMVGSFGEVYLLDWGIAVSLEPDPEGRFPCVSQRHMPTGTPVYMAPEMADGAGELLRRETDVFLLGAVLFEVLTGGPPRQGMTQKEVLATVAEPIALPPGLPEDLQQLLQQSLSLDPQARPTAASFRQHVERHLARRSLLELLEHTRERAEQLQRALSTDDRDRLELYDLLGELRFGLREVRRGWPENQEATALERSALLGLAQYECATGDPRAARLLLAEVDVPDQLAEQITALERAIEDDRARLERLAADASSTAGQEARLIAIGGLALIWVGTPLLLPLLGIPKSFGRALASVGAQFFATLCFGVFLRHSLLSTRFNRSFIVYVAAQPLFAAVLITAAARWGLTVDQASVLELVVATAMVTVAALTLDLRVLFSAVPLGLATAVAVFEPTWVRIVAVPCYTAVAVNVWLIRDRLGSREDDSPKPGMAP